jgi:uncharacterized protein HemX
MWVMWRSTRAFILRLAVAFGEHISRTLRRVAALIAAVAAVLVPAACGGGGAALTQTGGTRPAATLPARTTPTATAPATTAPVTTAPVTTAPGTTNQGVTITRTETQTQTETQTAPVITVQAPTTTAAAETSTSSTPWGWIIAGLILIAAVGIGFAVWKRGRDSAKGWGRRMDDLTRRLLVSLDDVVAKGSVVTGQVEALAAEARTLERSAPDDLARAAAGRLRGSLDELAAALEADRALHLATPPPSTEQVAYSTAVVRERVEQLKLVLRPSAVEG